MHYTVYLRLVVLTAGTLLPFFWIVVILGHRRQRNFERVFFFLCLALVFFFGASLLELNASLYYTTTPKGLARFSWGVLCIGLWFLPSLLIHLHTEYAEIRELLGNRVWKQLWLIGAYAPAVALAPWLYFALQPRSERNFLVPASSLGRPFQVWLVLALVVSVVWQWRFMQNAPDEEQRAFHGALRYELVGLTAWIVLLHAGMWRLGEASGALVAAFTTIAVCFALAPMVVLLRNVQRFNFLQIGRQQNLIYAVFAAVVGLLYLAFVRRVSQWAEPYFPPEATAGLLLFLPVLFFEPLQRLMKRILRRTAQRELDRAQRLMGPIQEVARLGDQEKLKRFVEKWIGDELQLAEAKLVPEERTLLSRHDNEESFSIRQSGRTIGTLIVKAHGAMLSGETVAALEFLCEQLPGALEMCRLIEEKLKLQRELAERERLAALGQMAASISHNLKNPLGSMKTILQVQLESPEMPESLRGETKMVLEEIGRLSTKLNQLLQFSRPAVIGNGQATTCDAREIAREVVGMLRPEAQRKGVALELKSDTDAVDVAVNKEALNDILTNLVVNAVDAAPRGGHVQVCVAPRDGGALLSVEDDGPGVPAELREKILQPFFTTKTQGTGLGLAIVARRAADAGGKVELESPARNGSGTRFRVTLPMREMK